MLGVRLHDDILAPLDKFIAEQEDAPSRPEAIRRILADWFAGQPGGKGGADDED